MKLFKKPKLNKRTTVFIVLVVLFVISGLSIMYMRHSQQVKDEQASLNPSANIAPAKKSATSLFFTNEKSLPTTYTPGQDISLSFVIQNHEGKTVDYPYTIVISGIQVASHTVTVKNKTEQTVNEKLTLPSDKQALTIQITLKNQLKTIQFSMVRAK